MVTQIHTDDISNVLILNKKAITNQEAQLFKQELEKFRPHQNRILQANHKQASLMKDLTRTYGELLKDKRVRSEQNKYEAFSRQRNAVLSKYRKVYQAYMDLQAGLERATQFYEEMNETVQSMKSNVESFVENRRSEGGQLLGAIEALKGSGADREQARLKELMERMSVSPSSGSHSPGPQEQRRPPPLQLGYGTQHQQQSMYNPIRSPPITPGYGQMNDTGMSQQQQTPSYQSFPQQQQQPPTQPTNGQNYRGESYPHNPQQASYNPNTYGPVSPPAHQQFFSPPPQQNLQQPSTTTYNQQQPQYGAPGWQPPPPPPGPPPSQEYQAISAMQVSGYPSGPGGYASDPRRSGPGQSSGGGGGADPWAGLSGWQ